MQHAGANVVAITRASFNSGANAKPVHGHEKNVLGGGSGHPGLDLIPKAEGVDYAKLFEILVKKGIPLGTPIVELGD